MQIHEAMALCRGLFGVLVKNARTSAGKSQKDCAEVLGCSPPTKTSHEYGRRDISLPELEVLARFLEVPSVALGKKAP